MELKFVAALTLHVLLLNVMVSMYTDTLPHDAKLGIIHNNYLISKIRARAGLSTPRDLTFTHIFSIGPPQAWGPRQTAYP